MELPIDHFRLLGVSPTTDSETVLHTLQHRLDRAPDQGFTHETIQARAELLRSSADLLSDEPRRRSYEDDLLAIETGTGTAMAALDIPNSLEVGGLLLLMEAGQALESFEQVCRSLQPPQAPALGSGREADLTLLAGLACQAAAEDYRQQRRYEAAARTLQQGLQLLQRMGQQPEQRRHLEQELSSLLPYRILDLLSRELSARSERQEGLKLLEQLVLRRGGLEGHADPQFPSDEFQAFFKQIRQFLTAQEQIDLFSRWAMEGSATADFLTSFALTASGFVQRKPERITAAFERLQAGGQAGVGPFLACQQLLLGQIDQAEQLFEQGATDELKQWAASQGPDPLAGLCAYCRDWLSREVLPGFRDLEAEPDLEAWFADRDVQAYVEQQDRRRGRQATATTAGSGLDLGDPGTEAWSPLALTPGTPPALGVFGGAAAGGDDDLLDEGPDLDWPGQGLSWPRWSGDWLRRARALPLPQLPAAPSWASLTQGRTWSSLGRLRDGGWPAWGKPAAIAALVAVASGAWVVLRPNGPNPSSRPPTAASLPAPRPVGATAPSAPKTVPPAAAPVTKPQAPGLPLRSAEPSAAELQALLGAWLAAKAAVLAGEAPPQPLEDLARTNLVQRVSSQGRDLANRNQRELVTAHIQDFQVDEQGPRRIAAHVTLRYADERRSTTGELLARSPETDLHNLYVFARDGDTWRLAAFRPQP